MDQMHKLLDPQGGKKTPVGERDWLTGTVWLPVGGLLVWVLGVFRNTVSEEYGAKLN